MEGPLRKYPVPHAGLVIALMAVIVVLGYLAVKIPSPDGWSPITGFATKPATCGNNSVETSTSEQCDGLDDTACPNRCRLDCTCAGEEKRTLDTTSRHTFYFVDLAANATANFAYSEKNISFSGLAFSVPRTQEDFRIIVDVNISADFPQPDGINYQFFEILLLNISDQNITTSNITFSMPQTWANSKNISADTTKLLKLPDHKSSRSDWITLNTIKTGSGKDATHFLAISRNPQGVYAVNSQKNINCGDNVCDVGERSACCTDCGCPAGEYCSNSQTCIDSICGNGIINEGETSGTCCEDIGCPAGYTCQHNECQLAEGCGDNKCEQNENVVSCPQDCTKQTFFNPLFVILISGIIIAGIVIAVSVFGIKFTFAKQKEAKKYPAMLISMVENEEQLREFIKENLKTQPLPALRKQMVERGWPRTQIDTIIEELRPPVSDILPQHMTFEKYVRKLLGHKSIDDVRAELQLAGWPMQQIDETIKIVALEKLAMRFEMHKSPHSPEKFHRFVKATKLLGYGYDIIKKTLLENGWDEKIIIAELGKHFI